jgi:glycosyltransferase involved in cell wall biosynthesis
MKVLLASFDPLPAAKGAARHILRNHHILTGLGHSVSLLTLGDGPAPGLRHIALQPPGETWLERAVAFHDAVKQVLAKSSGFDVVHVRSPFEGLAVPDDTPLVYEVNALYSIEIPVHYPDLLAQPGFREKLRANELLLLQRAAAVCTPSPVTARYLGDLGVDDVHIVPNAPSIPRPRTPKRPTDTGDSTRLVYIGTLSPWQGLHQALRCLGRLTHLDWSLDIYTGARRTKWLHKLVAKQLLADRVRIRPGVPPHQLGAVLGAADIGLATLTPSERNLVQGCMPVKLLDYMRAGLCVLGPDMEVVTHILGSDSRQLYRAWSRTSLTEQLEALIGLEPKQRAAIGKANQARVEAVFSEAVQAGALAEVYAGLGD